MNQPFRTAYMDEALFSLSSVIKEAKKNLAEVEYDTLIGTGFSGGIVVPAMALALGKKFALVRKETDDSHHGRGRIMGEIGERWVFVDDFVGSGTTRRYVISKINDARINYGQTALDTTLIGTYQYAGLARDYGFQAVDEKWGRL